MQAIQPQIQNPSAQSAMRRIAMELTPVLDDEELAQWFAEPSPWLADRRPIDLIDVDFARVFDAARAHRFACNG
jgi:uncharacterized protein (DUF2384 family)